MARQDFVDGLRKLGFDPQSAGDNRIVFPYTIDVGKLAGTQIKLGFAVPDDFPFSPPSGPHLCPRIHPIHTQNDIPHPLGGVHPSDDFGQDWQYWSRPHREWQATDRTVKTYMAYIRKLFATQ